MTVDIIGFTGLKGSGKSTAAKSLRSIGADVKSFASPLKDAAQIIFDIPESMRNEKSTYLDQWGMTIREMYQKLGTEVGRQIDPEVWIKNMDSRIQSCDSSIIVIDDVRFLNEAEFIRNEYDGQIIGIVERGSDDPKPQSSHTSETQMVQNWHQMTDDVIQNPKFGNGTFENRVLGVVERMIDSNKA